MPGAVSGRDREVLCQQYETEALKPPHTHMYPTPTAREQEEASPLRLLQTFPSWLKSMSPNVHH